MQKMYRPIRIAIIFVVLAVSLTIYVSSLYRIQILETMALADGVAHQRVLTRTVTLQAARGNIYDRNGILLASGRPSHNITLDRNAMRATGYQTMNEAILELVYATMDAGFVYTDTFPVTRGAPFDYVTDMTRTQRNRLDAYFDYHNIDPDISASDFLAWMRGHYEIDYTIGILDARLITGVRYELEMRVIIGNITPYVFTRDVSTDFITLIEERGYIGVHAESSFIREYHTTYAAHILGYIRRMSPEQYERRREQGYPMDAMVGQIGAEFAFEDLLRGIDGRQRIRSLVDGTVIDVITLNEPIPGNHVYLSMDLGLQIATEHALRTQIDIINRAREEEARLNNYRDEVEPVLGGAVVVTDVRTGEVLAAASYPTFNPMTLSNDYAMLSTDPMNPLMNRATHGRYIPGSTFKMITGFAGLRHGIVNRYTEIDDVGRYTRYEAYDNFAPSCWIFPLSRVGHGRVNLVQAIECSCNYYFMSVADWFSGGAAEGARILAGVAQEFGLGISTGFELPENAGRLATPEWKLAAAEQGLIPFNERLWNIADSIVTGFGQGENRFTPLQLANYSATIANNGTLHSLTILRRVMNSDFSETLHSHSPIVLSQIEEAEYIGIIQEGMLAVSRGGRGTARAVFRDYPVRVAAKTGTAQVEGRDVNDGIFVCYAPYNNPEIAISIVVEKGGSGSGVMDIARMIFDYYFRSESSVLAVPYGDLIP